MPVAKGLSLTTGALEGMLYIHKYRFLSITQFASIAKISYKHAAEMLGTLERKQAVGFFGYTSIPGHGRTPKAYFLKRRGFDYLLNESDFPEEEIGRFTDVHQEVSWTPQMYHRLRLLDLFIALEVAARDRPHLELVQTLLEYRRIKGTHARETTDYVSAGENPANRIVPDGAFVLENHDTGRRGLFFVEMDMGNERITAPKSVDQRATIRGKFEQYDRYLLSGRFAQTYKEWGDFRSFTLLFVTYGRERIDNIRRASTHLPERLHGYYRLIEFDQAITNFLGGLWITRSLADTMPSPLIQLREETQP